MPPADADSAVCAKVTVTFSPAAVVKERLTALVPVAAAFLVGGLIILWVEARHKRAFGERDLEGRRLARVETVDELARRIDQASRFLPLDQLALSPQCGFASGIAGNLLTEDEQWRKLDVMLETARKARQ